MESKEADEEAGITGGGSQRYNRRRGSNKSAKHNLYDGKRRLSRYLWRHFAAGGVREDRAAWPGEAPFDGARRLHMAPPSSSAPRAKPAPT